MKSPNLRIHGVEKGTEIQTKDTGNIFSEIIAGNFSSLCYDTHLHEAFQTPNLHAKENT
jgi:hypothetical protein